MAARTWLAAERLVHPHLLVGLETLLAPPIHHLGPALRSTFPAVKVLSFKGTMVRYDDGTALVTVGLSYTGPPLPVVAGDVERLVSALQTPTVEHRCPTRADTFSWIRCANDDCPHGCAAEGSEPGWFLVGCCGVEHLPQGVIEHLVFRCGGCQS